jgi:hypothetical protein
VPTVGDAGCIERDSIVWKGLDGFEWCVIFKDFGPDFGA